MTRKTIHLTIHKPTGAEIPIVVNEVNESYEITDYQEYSIDRKYFTLDMLCKRWGKWEDYVLEILKEFQVPAHMSLKDIQALPEDKCPAHAAKFFSEYIEGIERKLQLPHKKIKAKSIRSTE